MAAMTLLGTGPDFVVFLPGFMLSARSYRELLEPVAASGITVVVPQLYRRGPAALLGHPPVTDEAQDAAVLVRETALAYPSARIFLGGHSRGGQAAWRAAAALSPNLPAGLLLLDPVDGEGRRPSNATATSSELHVTCPSLIIGAGIGGACAPANVNHEVFAAATPGARHAVVTDMGHADMLCGRELSLGRRLCPGAVDPRPGREACATLITSFVDDQVAPPNPLVTWVA